MYLQYMMFTFIVGSLYLYIFQLFSFSSPFSFPVYFPPSISPFLFLICILSSCWDT